MEVREFLDSYVHMNQSDDGKPIPADRQVEADVTLGLVRDIGIPVFHIKYGRIAYLGDAKSLADDLDESLPDLRFRLNGRGVNCLSDVKADRQVAEWKEQEVSSFHYGTQVTFSVMDQEVFGSTPLKSWSVDLRDVAKDKFGPTHLGTTTRWTNSDQRLWKVELQWEILHD